MSSPIGGFYMSAQQRHKRKLAEYDARLEMKLAMTLINHHEQDAPILELNEVIVIGATYQFGNDVILSFTSKQLESGLFEVSLHFNQIKQTLTLSEDDSLSSQLADDDQFSVQLKLTKAC